MKEMSRLSIYFWKKCGYCQHLIWQMADIKAGQYDNEKGKK